MTMAQPSSSAKAPSSRVPPLPPRAKRRKKNPSAVDLGKSFGPPVWKSIGADSTYFKSTDGVKIPRLKIKFKNLSLWEESYATQCPFFYICRMARYELVESVLPNTLRELLGKKSDELPSERVWERREEFGIREQSEALELDKLILDSVRVENQFQDYLRKQKQYLIETKQARRKADTIHEELSNYDAQEAKGNHQL
jgi:hypothetical protein